MCPISWIVFFNFSTTEGSGFSEKHFYEWEDKRNEKKGRKRKKPIFKLSHEEDASD